MKNNFYITTPIYYPNAEPHIGSIYTTLLADMISRYMKLKSKNVEFLTGTDEHGQKVYEAAKNCNMETNLFLNNIVNKFKDSFQNWNIDYTIFMRTTTEYHKKAVSEWIINLTNKGFIYKGKYEGWYSTSSESFILEKDIEKRNSNNIPICPISEKPAIWVSQDAYYFKLSYFTNKLIKFYEENPNFITPKEKINEIISFVKGGLNDLCISRSKKDLTWGIPYPGDDEAVVYVWADALNSYITAIGYLNKEKENHFNNFWPCDLHILGKDISRFHAVYWPAFLMASDLELPKRELVHGWILVNNTKMSKSIGNVIKPDYLISTYGIDASRYYLLRYISINQDSEFSYEDLEEKNNADLANALGNLLQRIIILSLKNNLSEPGKNFKIEDLNNNLFKESIEMLNNFEEDMKDYIIHKSYSHVWRYINTINAYFHESEPWKVKDKNKFEEIIICALSSLRSISIIIWPIIPYAAEKILNSIGYSILNLNINNIRDKWNYEFNLKLLNEPLFKKFEKKKEEEKIIIEEKKENKIKNVNFEHFATINIVVGQIIEINDLEKSNKLYSMIVDFGEFGKKHICAGIKNFYKKEELINIKSIFVYNLEPRSLCGVTSEGMTLMVKNEKEIPIIIKIDDSILNGTKLT